jgi:hypothetical protein
MVLLGSGGRLARFALAQHFQHPQPAQRRAKTVIGGRLAAGVARYFHRQAETAQTASLVMFGKNKNVIWKTP